MAVSPLVHDGRTRLVTNQSEELLAVIQNREQNRTGCWMDHLVRTSAESSLELPSPDDLRSLDPDAWETLYRYARPVLWRFARSRLATDDQAEDAVSETMVRAMSAMARYRHGSSGLVGWLVGIERNVVNEMYRAGQRQRAVPHRLVDHHNDISEPVDRLVAAEEVRALRVAFAGLPSDDQELLGLRVIARLDADAIAKMLGKRPGAIRMAQARALGRLRVTLREGTL